MTAPTKFAQSFFHGTKADLKPGDRVEVGHQSNYMDKGALSWCYFSATMDAAIWAAELARGAGPERLYVVEPTGEWENDPNLTDRKFPGNPTLSFRSRSDLVVLAEVTGWTGHAPEALAAMREGIGKLTEAEGAEIID